jgi:hypothetical protein
MRQLLLPPRISGSAGASRSLRHKGTVAARLKRRKELKGTKKITDEPRGKREGGQRGVEMCERSRGMKSDQGFRERVSLSLSRLLSFAQVLRHSKLSNCSKADQWTQSSTP